MLKIDIHTHILPENWPSLKERYGYGGFVHYVTQLPPVFDRFWNNPDYLECKACGHVMQKPA